MKYITTVNKKRDGDKTSKEIEEIVEVFNDYVHKKHPVILFLYLSNCGPCNETKKYWETLSHELMREHKHSDVLIAEINENQQRNLKGLDTKIIKGFPHIVYIHNKNIEYDEPEGRNHALVKKWINNRLSQHQQGGSKKSRKNKTTKRTKKNRKQTKKVRRRRRN